MRPKKCKEIKKKEYKHTQFVPDISSDDVVYLTLEELEAIRLKDLQGCDCISWWDCMGISKSTFANIYNRAHKKIADAIINGKKIILKIE